MAEKDALISFRVNAAFKARLEQQARKEKLSVSGLVLREVSKYLEEKEAEEG